MHNYSKNLKQDQKLGKTEQSETNVEQTISILKVPVREPWLWLMRGASDIKACHYFSLLYGLCFVLMGLGIASAHAGNPTLALCLSAAFLFLGPFLSLGIYELSRQIQATEHTDLALSLFSWCRNPKAVGRFAAFLSAVMVIWLWLSWVLLASIGQENEQSLLLTMLLWLALALLVFMASVVAMPLMLDRPVNALHAIKISVRCFFSNIVTMSLWAIIVAVSVSVSLWLHFWPLLLVGPLLGHATWHAYNACLRSSEHST